MSEKNPKDKNNSFMVNMWSCIFKILSYISIFFVVRKIAKKFNKKISYKFVDCWVFGNLIGSIAISLLIYSYHMKALVIIILVYSILRVFEIIIYQINVVLFDAYRFYKNNNCGEKYVVKSPTRMIILLFHNYAEIIFWYASIYIALTILSGFKLTGSWLHYINMSMLCFSTFDVTVVTDNSLLSLISNLAFVELISGMIMTIVSIARFIGLLPAINFVDRT